MNRVPLLAAGLAASGAVGSASAAPFDSLTGMPEWMRFGLMFAALGIGLWLRYTRRFKPVPGLKLVFVGAMRKDERSWSWAVAAPYHAGHQTPIDGPDPHPSAEVKERLRTMLSRDWGIEDRASLIQRLNALGESGHRRRHVPAVQGYSLLPADAYQRMRERFAEKAKSDEDAAAELFRLDAAYHDMPGVRGASFLAFDAARAVMLARSGYSLGWLTEAETWTFVLQVGHAVQAGFASWEAYGRDYTLGRQFWAGTAQPSLFDRLVTQLLQETRSPWRQLRWDHGPKTAPDGAGLPPDAPYWTNETWARSAAE